MVRIFGMGYEILYRECIDTSTFEQLVISLFWILFQNSVHLESFLNPFLIALQIFLTFALKTLFNTNSYTTCTLSENMPEGLSVTKSIQFYLENGNSKRIFRQFEWNWTVMAVQLKTSTWSFGGKWTQSFHENRRVLWCENEKFWSLETSSFIKGRPFWTLGFSNVGKIDENESEIVSNESDEFSAANSMFCGTVITGLFELGVSHLDLEVSKFNFWSLKFFLFDVVFLTCLFSVPNLLESVEYSNKTVFWVWIFYSRFFYWTSPPRRAVLTKNISVNFVNLEHSVEWSEYSGMVICHVGVLEH